MKLPFILAANSAEQSMLANAAEGGSPFAILQPDGFTIPYGEFPHKQGTQIFDRAAAEEMVANHNGALSRLARWARGQNTSYPVYVGHPDMPGSKDNDKRAYGWIETMIATDNGLELGVKWSDAGRELVENAHFKFYSPLWWTRPVKGKRGCIQPVSLKSMGLTNDPNIPVPALANESDSQPENNDIMNPELLAALGLEEGATLEEVLAKITALKSAASEKEAAETKATQADEKATTAENARVTAESGLQAANDRITTLTGELGTANGKVTTLEGQLRIAANAAVAGAVQAGRITPAEAEGKLTEILAANDLQVALDDLSKIEPKVKTKSATGDLGAAKTRLVVAANDKDKADREERARLVDNEFQNINPALSKGERKRLAWQRAQAKNPELFNKKNSSGSAA